MATFASIRDGVVLKGDGARVSHESSPHVDVAASSFALYLCASEDCAYSDHVVTIRHKQSAASFLPKLWPAYCHVHVHDP
jgi:hypothetical protein